MKFEMRSVNVFANLAVELLFEVVVDGFRGLDRAVEVHEGDLFGRVRELVAELLKVFIG